MITAQGFSKGADGMFVDPSGRPISIEIRTTSGDELRNNAMLAAADMWKAIGIGAETLIIPRQRASDREYRVTRPAFELTHQPGELTERSLQRFLTKEVPTAANGWRGNNRARYASPAFDSLVERYLTTFTSAERLEGAKAINKHISEQLPALGLLYRIEFMLISNRLANISSEQGVRNAVDWDTK
jgi:peptide/nickel transport system substrate-binding protein